MGDVLVDEVRDEAARGDADVLFVLAVAGEELLDEALEGELADLGEFCVEDGDERCVHVGEGGRELLRLDDGLDEEASASDDVFFEELANH